MFYEAVSFYVCVPRKMRAKYKITQKYKNVRKKALVHFAVKCYYEHIKKLYTISNEN